jgi:hypothetical protein
MAGFFYYLPEPKTTVVNDGRLCPSLLDAYGFAAVFRDVARVPDECVAVEIPHGPDNQRGTLLYPVPTHGQLPARLGYDAETQLWAPPPAAPNRLPPRIGYYLDAPPTPVDLERRRQIPGWEIRDAYGDAWSIPVARSATNPRGNLPFVVNWDDNAAPYCGVAAEHRQYWDDSARLWDLVLAGAKDEHSGLAIIGTGFTAEEDAFLLRMAHAALGINYRVTSRELSLYNPARPDWLSQLTASLIANAIVDMHGRRQWEAAQKKTVTPSAPAGVSSTPGEPAAGQHSAPAAAN